MLLLTQVNRAPFVITFAQFYSYNNQFFSNLCMGEHSLLYPLTNCTWPSPKCSLPYLQNCSALLTAINYVLCWWLQLLFCVSVLCAVCSFTYFKCLFMFIYIYIYIYILTLICSISRCNTLIQLFYKEMSYVFTTGLLYTMSAVYKSG